ncbi:MAG: DUF2085 domain-containing protein [Chloroflexota bacterium]|nr:MAG: DUF2085 domain-containing protein [Chloroflexota bacterium]
MATLDRIADGVIERWLAVANWGIALFAIAPFAAPILMATGLEDVARSIYWLYSFTCHQLPSHSWFLLGQQVAFCQRDTAIYLSMVVGGVLYARQRAWTRGLPWWAYVLASLPIALDGGAATLGLRESTPLLRSVTGAMFGLATTWFVYPLMDRSLAQLGPAARTTIRLETALELTSHSAGSAARTHRSL